MRPLVLLALALLPAAAAAQALQVKASPQSPLLGRDAQVTIRVAREGAGPLQLEAAASAGTLSAPGDAGPAGVRFTYTPPSVRHPLWVTLLFWERPAPGQAPVPTAFRLALLGRTTLDIATEPDAQVVVQVQRARFGPVRANAQGQARVAVEVPPGVRSARVLATAHGEQTERDVPLDVPVDGGLAALLGPTPVPAQGPAWLAVAAEEALTPEALELEVQGGRATLRASRPPLYQLTPEPGQRRLGVTVSRRQGEDRLSLEAEVSPQPTASAPSQPAAPPARSPLSVHALAGAFFAEGASKGPALALGAGYVLPALQERLALEAEVGLRRASLEGAVVGGVDPAHSRILGVPVLASLRASLLERGALSLAARLGAGLTLFRHRLQQEGQSDFSEGGLRPAGFAALQGGYTRGHTTFLLEARGSVQPVSTPRLSAQLGGVGLSLGLRYVK
ncbi:hypothetical protein FGE12_00400 [Aggregicoccus sp. 17bor-14]|uniref:hypothetical protein n=1 Tax=Myxococcaceae TaxID=31 RepID=UPI00129CF9E7|nr:MULTISPECIES: hypothetical protein [Myxococcaceae]MBF5040834.1 hypothetical protein [Simulacricoccus sp. 17bor-14]MRI86623.1 hypothetical protein [Aggregicoccus sp. 17bor-14]